MMRLIYTACAIGAPDTCDHRSIIFQGPITPVACAMGAQAELAAQIQVGMQVVSWRCEADRSHGPERRATGEVRPVPPVTPATHKARGEHID